jgi:hypothetical protein
MIRGCNNNKAALAENSTLKKQNDSLHKKNIADSAEWAAKAQEYNFTIGFLDNQVKLHENVAFAYKDSLDKASKSISVLLARHTPIKPNTDTSNTLVPNPFIDDCNECFSQLQNGRDLVIRANNQRDSLDQSYKSKINLQANRINELGQQNKALQSTLTNEFSIAKKEEEKYAPRRIVYLSLSTLTWNGVLPKAVGAGLIYQDKHKRQVEIKAYGSNIGPIYETGIAVPLSLNRR